MKNIIALIPARMASSRFPGKPLVKICGKTMIEHVWRRVKMNTRINSVYIATCDDEILHAGKDFGAEVIMTASTHQRGTDRIAEACEILIGRGKDFDIALNIQGDEPLLNPETLNLLIDPYFSNDNVSCVNLIENLEGEEEINSYNNVKTVFDQQGNVLYFSRLPVPYGLKNKHYKQLGLYSFKKEVILQYPKMPMTPLEIAESVDMLRFVENNIHVKVSLTPYTTIGVDTPSDHDAVSKIMEKDALFNKYRDNN
ncbi:MAG: 3-deoxy-manno-octulosonate cytidylyltransferase [Prolixibacteraceae bacterium]|nr:3-deoxy-manno-octulosonate cytidylyltransferase [Prolixibacteraceae bacterium]